MKIKLLMVLIQLLVLANMGLAQRFGKNHVQYKTFDTYFLQSEHFDIFFTEGGQSIAEFTAETAEKVYKKIKADFRYELVDRIRFIVYNNHNDFESTNVQTRPGDESTGGFTEFFKNRVIIPFEGDWEKFRHVIHHELTHAVMLQMMYGAGVQSIISGMTRLQLPLWFIEGLAEYESRGWDTESDMFMRDAALNGYVPEIPYLNGFLAYKGGQSVLYYLSQKYGGEKIGELIGKIKLSKNLERGFKQSIGVGIDDLTKRWHKHLKREYWPDINGREEPEEFAKKLTDHLKDRNFINNSPALSPKGDKIVFLSDKSDYFDIYLMSAIDGKLLGKVISGQKTGNLDELHWLRPGLTWNPTGRQIAFASKSGGHDALQIANVRKKKIVKEYKYEMDGIFSPTWSPGGDEIAFVGMHDGQSDIFILNLKTEELKNITNDIFTDLEPSYSPNGKQIAFRSDRGGHTDPDALPPGFDIHNYDYRNSDIYTIDLDENKTITRITTSSAWEKYPRWSPDGKFLAYTSDRNGIYNIYLRNLETNEEYPITNVITGIDHLSWQGDGSRLAFTSFYYGGYDIYLMKNPLNIKPGDITLENTNYITKLENSMEKEIDEISKLAQEELNKIEKPDFKNYVFGENFAEGEVETPEEEIVFLDTTKYKDKSGAFKVKNYKPQFSPDIVYGNAGYSQFFGVQGTTQLAISDVFGNHRMELYTDLFYDMRNSNYMVRYFYLPGRTDFGFGAYHNVYFFYSNQFGLMRDRYFGGSVYASRPFNRYQRIDYSASFLGINREFFDLNPEYAPDADIRVLTQSLSYVKDTSIWGSTGPVNGTRSEFSLMASPKIFGSKSLEFYTFRMDYRHYFKFKKEYNFVFRFAGGASNGQNPQQFFLGGIDNWLNYRFKGGEIRINNPESIYFSTFETPLRGANYYERVGDRFALMNVEFRFPLIRYLILGWPLPLGVVNVRGALFSDIGTAWYRGEEKSLDLFRSRDLRLPQLGEDLLMGYGIGARAFVGFFLLRFDAAWKTDLVTTSAKPQYYFSIGAEF